ncbi:restriction endonuclease subunit S [Streptomyces brevispora]|uniref:restriction endonuclease subunit S n=1 Tax=Streptomyces brevispora TaxID=887462 RepID=UPI00371722F1
MSENRIAPWLTKSHWPTAPIRLVARLGSGHTPSRSRPEYWENCTKPWVTLADVWQLRSGKSAVITDTKEKISPLGLANSSATLHPAGTVILSRTASIGFSAIMGQEMATSQDFATWTCGSRLDSRYLLHTLRGMAPDLKRVATGSTHKTIYMPDIEQLRVPLPPVDEQRRIADFLDAETARIDALSVARQKQIERARERFTSLAIERTGRTHLRTGSLPTGWTANQLRRVVSSVKTGSTPPSAEAEVWVEKTQIDAVPWYGPSSFDGLLKLEAAAKFVPRKTIEDRIVPRFPAGSVLTIGIGATAGKVAYLDHEATGNQQITALMPEQGVIGRYLAWQLWSATEELRTLAPYTTLPIINNDFLKSFPIANPPTSQQIAITSHLDLAAQNLHSLEQLGAGSSDLLAERRQALITAAVTGQFDVSTASGRNVTDGVTA